MFRISLITYSGDMRRTGQTWVHASIYGPHNKHFIQLVTWGWLEPVTFLPTAQLGHPLPLGFAPSDILDSSHSQLDLKSTLGSVLESRSSRIQAVIVVVCREQLKREGFKQPTNSVHVTI